MPLAIVVLGGAFNPIHAGHITALMKARDYLEKLGIRIYAGYLAPAPDGYVKRKYGSSAISSKHRLLMCQAMVSNDTQSDQLKSDTHIDQSNSDFFIKPPDQCYGSAYHCGLMNSPLGTQIYIVTGTDRAKKNQKDIPNVHFLTIDRASDDMIASFDDVKYFSATLVRKTLCIGCVDDHSKLCLMNRKSAIEILLKKNVINVNLAVYLEKTPEAIPVQF